MMLYLLIQRDGDRVKYKLGGGSSTPAAPRIYASREQAERQSKHFGKGIEIIEITVVGS
ncbi:MAG: hypothetical protein BWY85_00738 [Firmicutes bacterium ADurb.Bin506]|nr:MAG: hypothetical protein BWY85_00738 [Firmicutes bacterium ADurb.Bin506]